MLKVKVVKSTRGRGNGCAQNIAFEKGGAFVTAAYSDIDWETKEYLIARLARVWNMTCDLPDEVIDVIEDKLKNVQVVSESTPYPPTPQK